MEEEWKLSPRPCHDMALAGEAQAYDEDGCVSAKGGFCRKISSMFLFVAFATAPELMLRPLALLSVTCRRTAHAREQGKHSMDKGNGT